MISAQQLLAGSCLWPLFSEQLKGGKVIDFHHLVAFQDIGRVRSGGDGDARLEELAVFWVFF